MNSSESKPSVVTGGLLTRAARSLVSPQGVKRVLWSLLWAGTVIALGYAIANFNGNRAWKDARQKLEAAGASYDYRAIIPKPVPDEQNFGALPIVTNWFVKPLANNLARPTEDYFQKASSRLGKSKTKSAEPRPRIPTDVVAWSSALLSLSNQPSAGVNGHPADVPPTSDENDTPSARAAAARIILAMMEPDRAKLETLREGLRRPYARYPIDYTSENAFAILLPHLSKLRELGARVQLHAAAELAAGDSAAALADLQFLLGLGDTLKSDPVLISHLVRMAMYNFAVQILWEGLHFHQWQPAELLAIERTLASVDFLADLRRALNGERAGALTTIDYCRQHHSFAVLNAAVDVESDSPPPKDLGWLIPNGWFLSEMANYSRVVDDLLAGVGPVQHRVQPELLDMHQLALAQRYGAGFMEGLKLLFSHEIGARALVPALYNVIRTSASGQVNIDQVRLASALERFRLANGHLPEGLQELAPSWLAQLPTDPITGQAYHYLPKGESFQLYSVGWDRKDDAGKPSTGNPGGGDKYDGDWAWGWHFRK